MDAWVLYRKQPINQQQHFINKRKRMVLYRYLLVQQLENFLVVLCRLVHVEIRIMNIYLNNGCKQDNKDLRKYYLIKEK